MEHIKRILDMIYTYVWESVINDFLKVVHTTELDRITNLTS